VTWQRALVFVHRWLGITGGLLFIAWFASGIVMIYVRMPDVDASDRHAARARLDYSSAHVAPGDALRQLPDRPTDVRLAMLNGRPVYRASSRGGIATIFADTGEPLTPLTVEQALAAARAFLQRPGATLRYDGRIADPDQWTLQIRALLPLHRIRAAADDDTVVYVSDRTGEVEMKATARERRWAYAGPVLHWLYFTPLRRHTGAWTQMIIWLSIAGCVMCMSGLAWGITVARRSPYAGIMRWHHYAGLIFGATTCTWIFSGLLSMDPWDWHPATAATFEQRDAVAGGPLRLDALTVEATRSAVATLASSADVKATEVVQFQHQVFLASSDRLVAVGARHQQALAEFDDRRLTAAAAAALPGAPIADATRLSAYDSYYYDRDNALPLPVLRVRFADPLRTWLYLDPRRGAIVRKEERLSRVNRWLYHGLHSLDFPILYARRPLWDVVMIALSLGGLASAITSIVPAWRRVRRASSRSAGL
jgi:hypothetical protein